MKIFFITRGLHDTGGIERMTSVIASELSQRGYDIGIVCLEKGKPRFPLHTGVKIHYINTSKFFAKKELKKLYAAESPDVVVFLGSHRSMMNIPASKGIPSVTWEHFNATINWHPLHKYSRKLAVKKCAKIVALTQADVQNYQQLFGARNVICIPNPITIDNIPTTTLQHKTLLAVGRLQTQKGFDLLIEAWAKTKARKNGWKLRIVGDGRHKKRLLKQIEKHHLSDSLEIVSATQNITEEYKNASAFVMSSRFEGLPLVLIEAMSAGLPIVSFDCETGPREIVKHNETGILVPPLNVDLLANAIDELLLEEEKIKQFSNNSLVESQKFSRENIVAQWEKLFSEIVSQSLIF